MKNALRAPSFRTVCILTLISGAACLFTAHVHAGTIVLDTAAAAAAKIDGSTQVYTAALNFNNWTNQPSVVINGLTFMNAGGINANPGNYNQVAGWNWSGATTFPSELSITYPVQARAAAIWSRTLPVAEQTGLLGGLLDGWIYQAGGAQYDWTTTLTLSGLTVGTEYSLTLYYSLLKDSVTTVTFNEGGQNATTGTLAASVNANHDQQNSVTYTYIAQASSISITIDETDNAGFRLYGLTNLDVHAAVPEPATWGLLLGIPAMLVGLCRRPARKGI